jgi:hypothetical protein
MKMTPEEALNKIVKMHKIDKKINSIRAISDNGLFDIK